MPDKSIAEALTWAFPYKDQIVASGLIPGVNAIADPEPHASGCPGARALRPGRGPRSVPDRRGQGQADPDRQRQRLGYEIKFLFSTDDPNRVSGKDALVKGLEAAGFKATPVADARSRRCRQTGTTSTATSTSAPAGWCSDWPSGATWLPPLFQSTDLGTTSASAPTSRRSATPIDAKIERVQKLPLDAAEGPGTTWRRKIMTKYLPLVPRYYAGVARCPRIADPGRLRSTTPSACRPSRHLGHRQ